MPKPPHPVDAAWLRLCAEQSAAYDCLLALVTAVREAGSPLARPVQRALRGEAAAAMAALGLERYERQGVRLTLVPAPRRTLRLRQAMRATGGATIVDLLARRAARERVAS